MAYEHEYSILIADDDESNLYILNSILRNKYSVLGAKTGDNVLKRAAAFKPDLILLDIVMPDMNGFDILSKLKGSEETHHIPVIIITGLDTVENEQRGFRMGAVDYITKPFSSTIVKARVDTHIKIIKQMRMIEGLGLLDPATEMPNKQNFETQINIKWEKAVHEGLPISLLMIDIDNFKEYNDTYGYLQGDMILKEIADILINQTEMSFRLGSDKFSIILPDKDFSYALETAELIRTSIESLIVRNGEDSRPTSVTVSIGAVEARPEKNSSSVDFIDEAEKALYEAKKSGRNKVFTLV